MRRSGHAHICLSGMQRSTLSILRQRGWAAHQCLLLRRTRLPHPSSRRLASTKSSEDRFARFEARLPSWLRRYTTPLRNTPVSHISSFLILHEITAVVPVFGLAYFFHVTNWLPESFTQGRFAAYMKDGLEKSRKYLLRKGWLDDADLGQDAKEGKVGEWSVDGEVEQKQEVAEGKVKRWWQAREQKKTDKAAEAEVGKGVVAQWWTGKTQAVKGNAGRWWGTGENGVRWFVEFGTAYAIVKVAMPLRIIGCVWATPWFARVFILSYGRPMWVSVKKGVGATVRRLGSLFTGG